MATVTVLTSAAAAGRLRALRHAGLVLVALFLAHELAYLARFADTARTATLGNEAGHAYWPALVLGGLGVQVLTLGLAGGAPPRTHAPTARRALIVGGLAAGSLAAAALILPPPI